MQNILTALWMLLVYQIANCPTPSSLTPFKQLCILVYWWRQRPIDRPRHNHKNIMLFTPGAIVATKCHHKITQQI